MVAPKPNETRLAGTVRRVRPNQRRSDVLELVVVVDRADDVEDRANLLAQTPGGELTVTTDAKDVVELGLQPGEHVEIGVELRGPGAVWSRPRTLRRGG
jgi:hypothetical protein